MNWRKERGLYIMDVDRSQRIFELNLEINTLDLSIASLNKQIKTFYAEKDKLVEELVILESEVQNSDVGEKKGE